MIRRVQGGAEGVEEEEHADDPYGAKGLLDGGPPAVIKKGRRTPGLS